MIIEKPGESILATSLSALCVPVNTVGVMGAGLAKAVQQKWPISCRPYFAACRNGALRPGAAMCGWLEPGPTLIFVATKEHWRAPSKMEWVENGIWEARELLRLLKEDSIAIPALGCGLGGLAWEPVRQAIHTTFGPVEAVVHLYPPQEVRHKGHGTENSRPQG